MALVLVSTLATPALCGGILVDDFNDGNNDGWTRRDITEDTPWGPAVMDVNGKGEYRLASAGTVPGWAPAAGGFFSTWDGSADPLYSDGLLRARMRIGDTDLETGLGMRLEFKSDTPPNGYLFSVRTRSWEPTLIIERLEGGKITESVREPFTLHVDEDLMIEAGAVGDQLSLKVWPASVVEPSTPQLEWTDSALNTGLIGLVAGIDAYATMFNRVDVIFDDLYFTPSGDMPDAAVNDLLVPEPTGVIGVLLAATCLAMLARKSHQGALVVALSLPIVCVAPVRGQTAEFDLGSFTVTSRASNHSLPIPAATYNSYRLTTDWSDADGSAWSQDARWIVADGALGDPATQYYVNHPGKAPSAGRNNDSTQLEWEGWLDIPLSGPRDVTLITVETILNTSARWSNTVLELSYQTPPMAPALDTDLGTIAHESAPFSITTTGNLDSELAVYSSTGAVLAKNDDAVGFTVNSALHFDYGLPPGQYIAAVGGFNTHFASGFNVTPGASSGDFGLDLAGKPAARTLAAGQVAYVGFSVSILGDVNGDNLVDDQDIDGLSAAIQSGSDDRIFDLNDDKTVSAEDRHMLVSDILHTWLGDADLNGEFASGDMVTVFTAGLYETGQAAGWAAGDWTGDGFFDSGDLVAAFSDGGYEQGLRVETIAVPEPHAVFYLAIGLLLTLRHLRTRPAIRFQAA